MTKKLIVLAVGLLLAIGAKAATLSFTATGASTNNLIQGSYKFSRVVIGNPGASAVTVAFFDTTSSTNLTFSYGGHYVYSNTVANVTNTYVSSTGVTNTVVFPNVIVVTSNAVAGATINLPKLLSVSVAAGNSITVETPFNVSRGLTMTNNGACTFVGTYSREF